MGQCWSLFSKTNAYSTQNNDDYADHETMENVPTTHGLKVDYKKLIRTTTYSVLNSENHNGSEEAGEVWTAAIDNEDVSRHWISYSQPNESIDYFISHTWNDDGHAKGLTPGVKTSRDKDALKEFGWRKSVAFQNLVRTIVEFQRTNSDENDDDNRTKLKFWVDKACIPQYDEKLKLQCIASFEDFIRVSHGLIVLLTPSYPQRLWCVYEVACFLCTKPMDRVYVNYRSFGTQDNLHIYTDAIRNFDIDTCRCKVEFDRTILERKVKQYYQSKQHFASFVKVALISLIVRDYYSYPPMIKTKDLYEQYVSPWLDLLKDLKTIEEKQEKENNNDNVDKNKHTCGFTNLHRAFATFYVPDRYEALKFDDDAYMEELRNYLNENVYPLINQIRLESCTTDGISLYQG